MQMLLVLVFSSCDTIQEVKQPDKEAPSFDSTGVIELSALDDTTYRFIMHKQDKRLQTKWEVEGAEFYGDTLTHLFKSRGFHEVQAELLDRSLQVIRIIDTSLYVDTVGLDPALFYNCFVTFEFTGKYVEYSRIGVGHEHETYSGFEFKRLDLTERPLEGKVTDWSFFADTSYITRDYPRTEVTHQLQWKLSGDLDSLKNISFSYADAYDRENTHWTKRSTVRITGAKLVQSTSNEAIYQLRIADTSSVGFDYEKSTTANYTKSGLHHIDWSVPSSARIIFTRK
jgi:hypothetical protein